MAALVSHVGRQRLDLLCLVFLLTARFSPVDFDGAFFVCALRKKGESKSMPDPANSSSVMNVEGCDAETFSSDRQMIAEQLAHLVVRAHRRNMAVAQAATDPDAFTAEQARAKT